MSNEEGEVRERLRLELETFLRECYRLGEGFSAVEEYWDAGEVAMMVFQVGDNPSSQIMRVMPIGDFENWRQRRQWHD